MDLKFCYSCTAGCGTNHGNIFDLPGSTPTKKMDSLPQKPKTVLAPQSQVRLVSQFLPNPRCARMLIGFILHRSCVGSHSSCDSINGKGALILQISFVFSTVLFYLCVGMCVYVFMYLWVCM